MPKKTALFIARFQPLHRGHEHAIREAMRKYRLVFVVGSINRRGRKNPFPYSKRREMIRALFPGAEIIGIADTTDSRWAGKIKRLRFDAVISGNPRVWKCLAGCRLEKPELLSPKKYNGTKIRHLLARGKSVGGLVPKKIAKIVEK